MKASELRIGNLLIDWHGRILTVMSIGDHSFRAGNENFNHPYNYIEDEIQPIKLTKEWHGKLNRPDDMGFGWLYVGASLKVFHKGIIITILRTVHQYQNFYSILSGQELSIEQDGKA